MSFDTEHIARITHAACALFGLDLLSSAGAAEGPMQLVASIEITGQWTGTVAMGCSAEFAHRLAAAVFQVEAEELSSDDVADAFGELVNVAAGNIKALLPAGCAMGVPSVAHGADLDASEPARSELWRFQSDGDPLAVVIRPTPLAAQQIPLRIR